MTMRIDASALREFCQAALVSRGADAEQAAIVADGLVWADLAGRGTHGVWRLDSYLKRFEMGLIACPCHPVVATTGPATATIDGNDGFGQVVGRLATEVAVERAQEAGVGIVTARRSNHFGAAGYLAEIAARSGMLAVVTSNSIAKVAPFGGARPVFGTNPIAVAVPRPGSFPIVLDMATAAASGASVIQAAENGEDLDEGILVDGFGRSVTDPGKASDSTMLTFGGAKGSGIALLVEVLSSVLAGAALSSGVRSMFGDFSGNGDNGHCVIAVDIGRFTPPAVFADQLEHLVVEIRQSAPVDGQEVLLPGERTAHATQRQLRDGVVIDRQAFASLRSVADRTGIELPAGAAAAR